MRMGFFSETWLRITTLTVPTPSRNAQICCGILNCIFFGCGTIIAGILENNLPDVAIGLLQLCIPFVGWIWSICWGIMMIVGK